MQHLVVRAGFVLVQSFPVAKPTLKLLWNAYAPVPLPAASHRHTAAPQEGVALDMNPGRYG